MKELKKYELKAARKPKVHALLSGVVHVCDSEGKGYAYISFSEAFVDAVGKLLPQGLRNDEPAFIKVLHMPGRKAWRVFAMYFKTERGVLLWEAPDLPSWISNVQKN